MLVTGSRAASCLVRHSNNRRGRVRTGASPLAAKAVLSWDNTAHAGVRRVHTANRHCRVVARACHAAAIWVGIRRGSTASHTRDWTVSAGGRAANERTHSRGTLGWAIKPEATSRRLLLVRIRVRVALADGLGRR